MKIIFFMDSPMSFRSGIWLHRIKGPAEALESRGHAVKQVAIGTSIPQSLMEWPDTVVFGRAYPTMYDPIKYMREYKKLGKRVLYDMDDDYWNVSLDNPSVLTSNAQRDQYEGMIREADAVVTPSTVLAKKFKKHFKKDVILCPNGIDLSVYIDRAQYSSKNPNRLLNIGYMGAASHWKDLQLIGGVIEDLSSKYDFVFSIYGITAEPLESALYYYKKVLAHNFQPEQNAYFRSAIEFADQLKTAKLMHIPFMPPELHAEILSRCDFDIGLAPLEDTEFNQGKSCIKFYEYAGVGTVTLASDVLPYSQEVNYLAKNTHKDWYKKIEKLIVDEAFREKTLEEQRKWVFANRTQKEVAVMWELACQRPGGLKVLNQG